MTETDPSKSKLQGYRLAGMGIELAGAVGGLSLLGWWIDRAAGTSPRWLVICAIVGLIGGMYNFIRQAMRESAEANRRQDEERESRDP